MSMHLCGPELTTTLYKKRKVKITKSQQQELERGWRERNQRLKEMRLPKETFEQYMEWVYGKGKKEKGQKNPGKKTTTTSPLLGVGKKETSSNKNDQTTCKQVAELGVAVPHGRPWITGPCSSKPSPTYTGTKIIGIGTMHKSNAVPIFSDDEAKEISSMRR